MSNGLITVITCHLLVVICGILTRLVVMLQSVSTRQILSRNVLFWQISLVSRPESLLHSAGRSSAVRAPSARR